MNIMKKAGTPLVHLEMIKKYFEYLALRHGNTDGESLVAVIDQMAHYLETGQAPIVESEGDRLDPAIEYVGY